MRVTLIIKKMKRYNIKLAYRAEFYFKNPFNTLLLLHLV